MSILSLLINPTTCNALRLTLETKDAHAHLMLTETDFQVNLVMDFQCPSSDLSFCGDIIGQCLDERPTESLLFIFRRAKHKL